MDHPTHEQRPKPAQTWCKKCRLPWEVLPVPRAPRGPTGLSELSLCCNATVWTAPLPPRERG